MLTTSSGNTHMILLIGASRGFGHAMAALFLEKGWHVVATVRGGSMTDLPALADRHEGQLEIEDLDITRPEQIAALPDRLSGSSFGSET